MGVEGWGESGWGFSRGRGGYLPVMMITGDEVGLGMVVGEEWGDVGGV